MGGGGKIPPARAIDGLLLRLELALSMPKMFLNARLPPWLFKVVSIRVNAETPSAAAELRIDLIFMSPTFR